MARYFQCNPWLQNRDLNHAQLVLRDTSDAQEFRGTSALAQLDLAILAAPDS